MCQNKTGIPYKWHSTIHNILNPKQKQKKYYREFSIYLFIFLLFYIRCHVIYYI